MNGQGLSGAHASFSCQQTIILGEQVSHEMVAKSDNFHRYLRELNVDCPPHLSGSYTSLSSILTSGTN